MRSRPWKESRFLEREGQMQLPLEWPESAFDGLSQSPSRLTVKRQQRLQVRLAKNQAILRRRACLALRKRA
jgi:hypothetical protein